MSFIVLMDDHLLLQKKDQPWRWNRCHLHIAILFLGKWLALLIHSCLGNIDASTLNLTLIVSAGGSGCSPKFWGAAADWVLLCL